MGATVPDVRPVAVQLTEITVTVPPVTVTGKWTSAPWPPASGTLTPDSHCGSTAADHMRWAVDQVFSGEADGPATAQGGAL